MIRICDQHLFDSRPKRILALVRWWRSLRNFHPAIFKARGKLVLLGATASHIQIQPNHFPAPCNV